MNTPKTKHFRMRPVLIFLIMILTGGRSLLLMVQLMMQFGPINPGWGWQSTTPVPDRTEIIP
jgi:hypothetical protein